MPVYLAHPLTGPGLSVLEDATRVLQKRVVDDAVRHVRGVRASKVELQPKPVDQCTKFQHVRDGDTRGVYAFELCMPGLKMSLVASDEKGCLHLAGEDTPYGLVPVYEGDDVRIGCIHELKGWARRVRRAQRPPYAKRTAVRQAPGS
jgi:hypothetical protein